jgi:DNA transformation protein
MNAEALKELFKPFGDVAVKRMFCGYGVYAEGLCFAIESDSEVFLKVDTESRASFSAAGSSPFIYLAKGKPMATSYWRLPPNARDEPGELVRWAKLGLEAARRAGLTRTGRPFSASARQATPVGGGCMHPTGTLGWRKRRACMRAYVKQLQPVAGS